jgi:hypothetical protein
MNLAQTSSDGGAIYCNSEAHLSLVNCLFHALKVYQWASADYGGAAYVAASNFTAERVCASNCRAEDGQAFYIAKPTSLPIPVVRLSSFTKCCEKGDENSDYGAITCYINVGVKLSHGNFTDCHVWESGAFDRGGSALCFLSVPADTRIEYSMFYNCSGWSTIDIGVGDCGFLGLGRCGSGASTWQSCVFRNLENSDAAIYLNQGTCNLSSCYFYYITGGRPGLHSAYNDAIFRVYGCFFSDWGYSADASIDIDSGNRFGYYGTFSHVCYFSSVFCQVSPLCPTTPFTVSSQFRRTLALSPSPRAPATQPFTATKSYTSTAAYSPSRAPSDSLAAPPSNSPADTIIPASEAAVPSAAIAETDVLHRSVDLKASAPIQKSAGFEASNAAAETIIQVSVAFVPSTAIVETADMRKSVELKPSAPIEISTDFGRSNSPADTRVLPNSVAIAPSTTVAETVAVRDSVHFDQSPAIGQSAPIEQSAALEGSRPFSPSPTKPFSASADLPASDEIRRSPTHHSSGTFSPKATRSFTPSKAWNASITLPDTFELPASPAFEPSATPTFTPSGHFNPTAAPAESDPLGPSGSFTPSQSGTFRASAGINASYPLEPTRGFVETRPRSASDDMDPSVDLGDSDRQIASGALPATNLIASQVAILTYFFHQSVDLLVSATICSTGPFADSAVLDLSFGLDDSSPLRISGDFTRSSPPAASTLIDKSFGLLPSNLIGKSIALIPSDLILNSTPLSASRLFSDSFSLIISTLIDRSFGLLPSNLIDKSIGLIPSDLIFYSTPLSRSRPFGNSSPVVPSGGISRSSPIDGSVHFSDSSPSAQPNSASDSDPLLPSIAIPDSGLLILSNPILISDVSVSLSPSADFKATDGLVSKVDPRFAAAGGSLSGGAAFGIAAAIIALAAGAGAAFWFFVYRRSDETESAEFSAVETVTLTSTKVQGFEHEDDAVYLSEENPMEVPELDAELLDDSIFCTADE